MTSWCYSYDMVGVDLADALRVAERNPIGADTRICAWSDTREPVSGRCGPDGIQTVRTLILWSYEPGAWHDRTNTLPVLVP